MTKHYCVIAAMHYKNVFSVDSSFLSLRNVLFLRIDSSCADVTTLLYVENGSLDIADTVLLGKGIHIQLRGANLTASGTVRFENGTPAIAAAQNSNIHLAGIVSFYSGNPAIQAKDNSTVNFVGSINFENGSSTAIQAINSHVTLAGNTTFVNNTGYQGGALSLTDSHVTIADNAYALFQGNHADHVGGAIYSTGKEISNYVSADLRVKSCPMLLSANSRVEFIDNTAESGGSAMYGITVSKLVCGEGILTQHNGANSCIYTDISVNHGPLSYTETYDNLLSILSIEPDVSSAVSSDPLRVCICPDQSTPDCLAILPDQNITHFHYTVYPGQNFTIPAAVVGFNFALTSGSVYAQFLNSNSSLGSESQYVQGVNQTGCSQLQYSVLSSKKRETLVLTSNGRSVSGIPSGIEGDIHDLNHGSSMMEVVSDIIHVFDNPTNYYNMNKFVTNLTDGVFRVAGYVPRSLQDTPVFISLTLLDCPPGFTLSDQHRKCVCNERLLKHNLSCNINDQTVHREGTTWINGSFSGNSSSGVIVHQHCPFGYCKQEPVDVDLTNPETQCAFDHYGTLCGACKPNFSLALGGSQCLQNCSNKYLLLLTVFILAGFALVFFIKVLNLTVSQGTINGLIFYANIVAANKSIFFPAQHNNFLSFLSVFISWLNLDLGIETCFIKGLDGYWKTWLQFVFPFYVWLIAAAIILVSHYSTCATKIFGDKSVSVLATLLLLSYAKLLGSIITVISYTSLEYVDNSVHAVWAFDGNIDYLSPKHIPLFLFALAIVLLLWLPYTAVLLSAPWLRTQTHRKGLRWLKPFLDAYYGPFKDKHHYWVGVLLVVRGVLFIFFASFFAVENNVNLLVTVVSSIFLSGFPGSVYKTSYLTALENTFFLNLGVLAAGTLYIRLVGGSQEALVTTSVGVAFLQFIGIIAIHAYRFVIVPAGEKCTAFVRARAEDGDHRGPVRRLLNFDSLDLNSQDDDNPKPVVTHSEVCVAALRAEAEQQLQHRMELDIGESLSANKGKGSNIAQPNYSTFEQHQVQFKASQVFFNHNTAQNGSCFDCNTPHPNDCLLATTDATANEAAGGAELVCQ